ncbi:MAG TPA: Asp-tRNA(Asn)/Glu-tRNA(Gln) amidotransferase subunit GatC [Candidatus Wallbacteria bacterium]|nr:Asp-tRNA(Asn)/Glu-tRNA(Gln) amidotransferase subunit GatC [Candidatus Wallbacteria bacterium]
MISKEEVIKISKLAMLELKPSEIEDYTGQLASILSFFEQIQELDLKNVEPTNNALVNSNVLREDVSEKSLPQSKLIFQSVGNDGKNFVVPSIIETGE